MEGSKRPRSVPDPEKIIAHLGPLDWEIISRLPSEGDTLGYHPMFKTVRKLTDELNEPLPPEAIMTSGSIGARVRTLSIAGLTKPVSISLTGKIDGWQRSARAIELLNAHKAQEAERERRESETRATAIYRDQQAQAADWSPSREGGES